MPAGAKVFWFPRAGRLFFQKRTYCFILFGMDLVEALRLHIEWGADEALVAAGPPPPRPGRAQASARASASRQPCPPAGRRRALPHLRQPSRSSERARRRHRSWPCASRGARLTTFSSGAKSATVQCSSADQRHRCQRRSRARQAVVGPTRQLLEPHLFTSIG